MAGLSRIEHARDDDAASSVRLLLADADAATRDGFGRQRGADGVSREECRGRRDFRARAEALSGVSAMQKVLALAAAVLWSGTAAFAQQNLVDPVKVDAAITAAFPSAPADWRPRFVQDDTMKQCSQHDNLPPQAVSA